MLQEEQMDILLKAVYQNGRLNPYDYCAEHWAGDEEMIKEIKLIADELVNEKLARYSDVQRTELEITNYGRYWVVRGGYFVFLKEGERKFKPEKEKHHEELSEELKEARLKFTHYRILTYWWGFALTLISFLLTLLNLYLILRKK